MMDDSQEKTLLKAAKNMYSNVKLTKFDFRLFPDIIKFVCDIKFYADNIEYNIRTRQFNGFQSRTL